MPCLSPLFESLLSTRTPLCARDANDKDDIYADAFEHQFEATTLCHHLYFLPQRDADNSLLPDAAVPLYLRHVLPVPIAAAMQATPRHEPAPRCCY
jgi:hypothetical protein